MRTTYHVTGLTCEHCVRHVLEEILALPGVQAADLGLADGLLRVTSPEALDFAAIQAAVHEAGDYDATEVAVA